MPLPAKHHSALMTREGIWLLAGGILFKWTVVIPDSTAVMPSHSADNRNTSFLLSPITIVNFLQDVFGPEK